MSLAALAAIFATSFLVGLTGALSPGPLSTMAVREGARRGFWAGPALAAGHAVVELVLVIGLALGLSHVLDQDAVAAAIALVGGLFLVWLGAQVIRLAPRQEVRLEGEAVAADPVAGGEGLAGRSRVWTPLIGAATLVVAGAALSVSNPFWFLWWVTLGTAYVAEALEQGTAGIVSFYSGHILSDLAWLSLIAFALASGRRLMSVWVYRGILLGCGLFLLALAGWFLATGLGYIF